MIRRRQFLITAGSIVGLPFFFPIPTLLSAGEKPPGKVPTVFEKFTSSCIDLGSYAPQTKELTVRFTGRKPDRFYRYSNVPPEMWEKLRALDKSGGVGSYLNETIVQQPKLFPFEVFEIRGFQVRQSTETKKMKKRKAEDSN